MNAPFPVTEASLSGDLMLTIAGQDFSVPGDVVLDIAHATPIAPFPFASQQIAGYVDTVFGPSPLLAFGPTHTGPGLHLVLASVAGRVCVKVDAVHETPGSEVPLTPILPSLAGMLQSLLPGQAGRAPQAALSARPRVGIQSFLRVRSQGVERALRAVDVVRLGHHSGVRALHDAGAARWLVELDDELLAARSLAETVGGSHTSGEECWCLRLAGDDAPEGLLVAEVLGLVEVREDRIRSLRRGDRLSYWLLLDGEAPLEVHLPDLASPMSAGMSGQSAAATSSIARGVEAASADAISGDASILMTVGRLGVAVPAVFVHKVLGPVDLRLLVTDRRAGAVPVLDLRRLTDGPVSVQTAGSSPWAIGVTVGRRPVVLLADALETAPSEPDWRPLPALPSVMQALLESLRIRGSCCEVLIARPPRRGLRSAEFNERLRAAAVGWLPIDSYR